MDTADVDTAGVMLDTEEPVPVAVGVSVTGHVVIVSMIVEVVMVDSGGQEAVPWPQLVVVISLVM